MFRASTPLISCPKILGALPPYPRSSWARGALIRCAHPSFLIVEVCSCLAYFSSDSSTLRASESRHIVPQSQAPSVLWLGVSCLNSSLICCILVTQEGVPPSRTHPSNGLHSLGSSSLRTSLLSAYFPPLHSPLHPHSFSRSSFSHECSGGSLRGDAPPHSGSAGVKTKQLELVPGGCICS